MIVTVAAILGIVYMLVKLAGAEEGAEVITRKACRITWTVFKPLALVALITGAYIVIRYW
ncbi:hypothetical protein MRQ47_004451 [Salmonella enterica]|nr:hypothetical protein [Salmonella enterica]